MFLEQMWEEIETEVIQFLQSLIKINVYWNNDYLIFRRKKNHQVATVYSDMI